MRSPFLNLNLGSTDPRCHGGAVLLEGEEDNVGALHRAIGYSGVFLTVHSDTHFNMQIIVTLRALRSKRGQRPDL